MGILACRDQDGNVFAIAPGPIAAPGFRELGTYAISIDLDAPCRMFVDEEELLIEAGASNRWTWQPRFHAGEVEAELRDQGGSLVASYRFDISPDPRKIGRESFAEMVSEILAFDPRLLMGEEPAKFMIGAEGTVANVHLHYARLRHYGHLLVAAADAVCAHPVGHLARHRERVDAHRARRFDRRSIMALARDPGALAGLKGDSTRPFQLDVPKSRVSYDTAAHRTLCAILTRVLVRIRSVADALASMALKEKESGTTTGIARRVPRRLAILSGLETSLGRILRRSPFLDVARPEVSAAGLNVISAHPLYARAFRMAWHLLRPGIDGAADQEHLWMAPTWQVYERWCFLRTFEALKAAFPALAWQQRYPSALADRIVFTGSGGGVTIRLLAQATFPAYDQANKSEFYSLSGERCPDIVVTHESGTSRSMSIIDAKYRVSRTGVLDAMTSAHLYRDSLRWRGKAPARSLLLIPAAGGAPWLETAEFLANHGVGVITLGMESGAERLMSVLQDELATIDQGQR